MQADPADNLFLLSLQRALSSAAFLDKGQNTES